MLTKLVISDSGTGNGQSSMKSPKKHLLLLGDVGSVRLETTFGKVFALITLISSYYYENILTTMYCTSLKEYLC